MKKLEPLVTFTDSDHSYWCKNTRLLSVSGFFHLFEWPFDEFFWKIVKAYELRNFDKAKRLSSVFGFDNPIILDFIAKEVPLDVILKEAEKITLDWGEIKNTATEIGTSIHGEEEFYSYLRGEEKNPFTGTVLRVHHFEKEYDNQSLADNLFDLRDGIYPELLLFNLFYGLCGQSDKVYIETINGKRYAFVGDYKTDRELSTTGFPSKYYGGTEKLKPPLSHLEQCNMVGYNLKMSLYMWMLTQFGYKFGGLYIEHIDKETKERTVHELPYMKSEVELMLKYIYGQ
jgi:hypothetical protein